MAVPAHDQRDFEFAKKYGIPIRLVIQNPRETLKEASLEAAYEEQEEAQERRQPDLDARHPAGGKAQNAQDRPDAEERARLLQQGADDDRVVAGESKDDDSIGAGRVKEAGDMAADQRR